MIDLSRAVFPPFAHQIGDIAKMLERPYSGNFSEMGSGKSKTVIDAACVMFVEGIIDRVIVVAPSFARQVWADDEIGQLATHLWQDLPVLVTEYHAKLKQWRRGPDASAMLRWIVTNYEYLRQRPPVRGRLNLNPNLSALLPYATPKTLLVLDESSAIKNPSSQQTRGATLLRQQCGRVVLLNGTPVSESPEDLFSQGNLMHPSILNCASKTQFRARYAELGPVRGYNGRALTDAYGRAIQEVKAWKNLDDLTHRFAPYVVRHMKADCLDLPAKMPTMPIYVTLTPKTWAVYKDMRDEAMVALEKAVSLSPQITTKLIRLGQITSGFLGGLEALEQDDLPQRAVEDVGREKLEALLSWVRTRLSEQPNFKLLVWSRWIAEVERTTKALSDLPGVSVGMMRGGHDLEREVSKRLLMPETMPEGPAIVVGSVTLGKAMTLTGTHTVVYMSNDWSYEKRLQSEDRVHRPGQKHVVNYFDMIATGPEGQRTVDQIVVRALAAKDTVALKTTQEWVAYLQN